MNLGYANLEKEIPVLKLLLFMLIAIVFSQNLFAQSNDEPHAVDFFLGEWNVEVMNEKGEVVEYARTVGKHILERTALQSNYFAYDRKNNQTYFRGSTIRSYVSSSKSWVVHWMMSNLKGYTYLEESWEEGELHASGHGFDQNGKFLERYRYFIIETDSYSFEMERSYDNGQNWLQYNRINAKRIR